MISGLLKLNGSAPGKDKTKGPSDSDEGLVSSPSDEGSCNRNGPPSDDSDDGDSEEGLEGSAPSEEGMESFKCDIWLFFLKFNHGRQKSRKNY